MVMNLERLGESANRYSTDLLHFLWPAAVLKSAVTETLNFLTTGRDWNPRNTYEWRDLLDKPMGVFLDHLSYLQLQYCRACNVACSLHPYHPQSITHAAKWSALAKAAPWATLFISKTSNASSVSQKPVPRWSLSLAKACLSQKPVYLKNT